MCFIDFFLLVVGCIMKPLASSHLQLRMNWNQWHIHNLALICSQNESDKCGECVKYRFCLHMKFQLGSPFLFFNTAYKLICRRWIYHFQIEAHTINCVHLHLLQIALVICIECVCYEVNSLYVYLQTIYKLPYVTCKYVSDVQFIV